MLSRYSVRTFPRVDVFFDVFVGGGELHVLLCHFDHSPVYCNYNHFYKKFFIVFQSMYGLFIYLFIHFILAVLCSLWDSFNLCLSEQLFISPSILNDNLAG